MERAILTKICTKCEIEQPISEYHKNKLGRDGRQPRCRTCLHEQQRKRRQTSGYGSAIKYKYGITLEQYHTMVAQQNNKCKICAVEFDSTNSRLTKPVIDHCHTTLKVRGVICHPCNVALGLIKENKNTLKNMIDYLDVD